MSYSHTIIQTLKDYDDVLYRMIEIKITSDEQRFEHRSVPLRMMVTDGTHVAAAFITDISEDQLELRGYYAVDAFGAFSGNVTISFNPDGNTIVQLENVTILPVPALPAM